MTEITSELSFVDQQGFSISIFDVLDTEDDIVAISSDDRLVKITGGLRIRVGSGYGCGGTTSSGEFEFEELRKLPKGSYELASLLITTISSEKERRLAEKIPWKRWYKKVHGAGYWLFDADDPDDYYINEALSLGVVRYIKNYK
ncbi:hypothetical protein L1267_11120 [Pseudoalteromonas sp. OFAV1]|jgi:hypothetical protein|uniref:hypothetical protein n=1 Tax=Pseudoalteromonas sp. OFAV1 TaxID=2908892 RepID=UPI001F1648B0|nr:hypothetical protein [Pseudoalteromonas sp. OFAV1]MCF2900955.1 hypothetical protein [Pseudoalteromonas sp. OFAV1]